jgi:CubicO group peptidase (beta-lactamase class C family)
MIKFCRLIVLPLIIYVSISCSNTGINETTIAKVDSLFSKWNNINSAGVSVAIWHKGQLITPSYGMADLEMKKAITANTKFDIASMSKQFTVMSILLLEEEGKLSVKDDIRKYLPELPDYGVSITIDQLMAHTSGLRDHFLLMELSDDCGTNTTISNDDVLRLLSRQKTLNFKPGTQQIYCNSGYVLLAIIVERVSKMSFPKFTKKKIFNPLKMYRSAFIDSPTFLANNCAKGYIYNREDSCYVKVPNQSTATGGTGMTTTASDLVKWYLNFNNNKLGKGSPELIKKMLRIPKIDNYIPFKRGYGLYVDNYKNTLNYWMAGSEIGYSSVMTYFPEEDFIAVILSNCSLEIDFANRFDLPNIFLNLSSKKEKGLGNDDKLRKKNKNLHTAEELRQLAGKYFDFNELDMSVFRFKDSALYSLRGLELIPLGRYKFKPRGNNNILKFNVKEEKVELHAQQYSYGDGYEYEYPLRESYASKQSAPQISQRNIKYILGKYKNEGTHKAIEIGINEHGVFAQWEGDSPFDLQPIFGDYLFSFGRYVFIKIDYDKFMQVKGFYLSYDRMRNLYFKKTNNLVRTTNPRFVKLAK